MTKKYDPKLDSNNVNTKIHWVCRDCWQAAQKASGKEWIWSVYATYHTWTCDFCWETKAVTEARDFWYPDFNLISKNY